MGKAKALGKKIARPWRVHHVNGGSFFNQNYFLCFVGKGSMRRINDDSSRNPRVVAGNDLFFSREVTMTETIIRDQIWLKACLTSTVLRTFM